ncbi:MAG TPA: nuclear transport factor 2 family protein [Candidatus Dormibacteraeota bacterium]|nr:nuclear transport factor 2 family protein [Candidatus Dormibacteraeota bacterium]
MKTSAAVEKTATPEVAGPNVDAVMRIMDAMEKAWSDKDLPRLFSHYWQNDGFVFFTSRGAYYGWESAKEMLERYFDNLDEVSLKFGPRKIRAFGDVATVVYEWRTDARSKLNGARLLREGYGTDVFLQEHGNWKLYHNHVSLGRSGSSRIQDHPW